MNNCFICYGLLASLLIAGLANESQACERWTDGQQLDSLLRLVKTHHPTLVSERQILQSTQQQHDWKAQLGMSYAVESTDIDAQGANAMLRLTIPLFDKKRELANAKQRSALAKAAQQQSELFLADLQKLCTQASNVKELETQREFYRDRLQYQQKRVDEGLDESVTLWSHAEKSQLAEFDYQREDGELTAQLITISRKYGGKEWKRLQALLGVMLN